MIRRPPRSTQSRSSAASDVYKRQVHESLDAVADLNERAERDDLGDLAGDDRADLEALDELLPRVVLRLLQSERDTLAVEVDVEDLNLDLVAPVSYTHLT